MNKNVVLCMAKKIISLDIRLTFSRNNFNVTADFKRGEELLKYLERDKTVDIIIMDVKLAGNLNGYETASKILKNNDKIRIIFISSGESGVYSKDFLHKERTHFIKMPFSGDDLMELLQISEQ